LLSSAVAAFALRLAGGDAAAALLGDLAAGTVVVYSGHGPDAGDITAKKSGSEWALQGSIARVTDAQVARTILVTATLDGRTALFSLDAAAAGVVRKRLATLDLTRRQSTVLLDQAPTTLLADDFGSCAVTAAAVSAVLACAELLGAAERSLELATQYAKDRTQFGVPIGSFQAIKHLLAESLAALEQMRAAVTSAAVVVDEFMAGPRSDERRLLETASVTKAYCSTAAPRIVETLIQVLGGIGYTWEHPAHLYLRRVRSLSAQFGSAREHRAALAAQFGLVSA
jgi:alkylation response protein AidB-like acyl-CoA dehydrogenase